MLGNVEDFVLTAANLRSLQGSSNHQAQFPSEDVRHEMAGGLDLTAAPILVDAEQVTDKHRFAVPIGAQRDVQHGRAV